MVEKYLWANLTTLLAVYDANDNLIQRFEYADQRMPVAMTVNNQKYYLHFDQVGSLRAVSDTSGSVVKEIVYDTYGTILSDSNPSMKVPLGFAGGLYDDDTGLTRFGYRDYDSFTGKWTAKDPIGFAGGDSNLYGYVLGDPVNLDDPDGLMPGDQAGQEALGYWINLLNSTDNPAYYIPAFFSALWTPDTSEATTETLMLCVAAGSFRYLKDDWFRFDPWGKWKNRRGGPWKKGPHFHLDPLKNSNELMRHHLPYQFKQWWNNLKNILSRNGR